MSESGQEANDSLHQIFVRLPCKHFKSSAQLLWMPLLSRLLEWHIHHQTLLQIHLKLAVLGFNLQWLHMQSHPKIILLMGQPTWRTPQGGSIATVMCGIDGSIWFRCDAAQTESLLGPSPFASASLSSSLMSPLLTVPALLDGSPPLWTPRHKQFSV